MEIKQHHFQKPGGWLLDFMLFLHGTSQSQEWTFGINNWHICHCWGWMQTVNLFLKKSIPPKKNLLKPGHPPRPSISTFYWSRNISSCLSVTVYHLLLLHMIFLLMFSSSAVYLYVQVFKTWKIIHCRIVHTFMYWTYSSFDKGAGTVKSCILINAIVCFF